jgi:predicted ATPase
METGTASIRTPDRRLRVFVSSTLQELAEERRAVRDAILGLHLSPVMFEEGARPHPPRSLYRAYLEQSDVFVGLYWQRYGWVAPGENVSGLEDEYRLSGDRPKLIYLKTPAPEREPGLSALLARIQADDRASYRRFEDANELRSLIGDDLAVMLTERFAASADPTRRWSPAVPVPRPPTRLVGREEDVDRVLDLLADPQVRVITVSGPGGIGKSRLAIAVAERARERYPDGIGYAELASVTEPSLLAPAIAKALGIDPGASAGAGLARRLADERMLLVLDNMEQLADAAGAVSGLLAGTRALQLLVTSRRSLNIRGECVVGLEPLPVPLGAATLTPAVELFLDRARAIRPGYEPDDQDLSAIAELCRRLDGLPLGIELAAAHVRVLRPGAILERMGRHRLAFLRTGAADLPERQRTLRDTIAWSHSLLPPDTRSLFARLAVFVGGAELDAIERVADPDGTLDVLARLAELVDGSLVGVAGDATEPRFTMLETIREFAVERLEESGDAARHRRRHEAYFLELAERGNAALGSGEQIAWLDRLARDEGNFRAVFRRAIRRGDPATAVRLGRSLSAFWHMRGSYLEGRAWMERVAALPETGPHERAVAWTIGAVQSFLQGDFEPLETGLDSAVAAMDGDGDGQLAAFAQMLRAIAAGAAGKDPLWREALDEAVGRLEAAGEALAVGLGLVAGAYLAIMNDHPVEARRRATDAYDLSRRIGESYVRAYATTQLARATVELGDWRAAQGYAAEALALTRRLRNDHLASYALELWAAAHLAEGRTEEAARLFALADLGYREVGAGPWRVDADRHEKLSADLRTALGDRYQVVLDDARRADFDASVVELTNAGASRTPSDPP